MVSRGQTKAAENAALQTLARNSAAPHGAKRLECCASAAFPTLSIALDANRICRFVCLWLRLRFHLHLYLVLLLDSAPTTLQTRNLTDWSGTRRNLHFKTTIFQNLAAVVTGAWMRRV